jgi:DNA-binding NtrC family response regulator
MIVDDKKRVKELFSQERNGRGHRVVSVSDAKSAKKHLKDLRPDLVILGLYPNGDEGWDLLRHIEKRYSRVPVLILTSSVNGKDGPRASQAEGYAEKSFGYFDVIKQKIDHLLQR